MIILRQKIYSIKYNPKTKYFEGKSTIRDRLKGAAILGGGGALLGGLAGSFISPKFAKAGLAVGGALGSAAGLYTTRQANYDRLNKRVETAKQAAEEARKRGIEENRKKLPLSYSEFKTKYPSQAAQLKGFEDYCYSDENPGDMSWYENLGLEKNRYLPVTYVDDYTDLLFDTKTKKYVLIDSEVGEPENFNGKVKDLFKNIGK